jgi:hypothetical protein
MWLNIIDTLLLYLLNYIYIISIFTWGIFAVFDTLLFPFVIWNVWKKHGIEERRTF